MAEAFLSDPAGGPGGVYDCTRRGRERVDLSGASGGSQGVWKITASSKRRGEARQMFAASATAPQHVFK